MLFNENEFVNERDDHSQTEENKQPNAYRVDNNDVIQERDLKRSFLTGNSAKPGMEGKPAGGHNFGKNNLTPSGDDKNNPSQNAGYTNEYFRRTEPSEEHPENSNFKSKNQDGSPDYDKAQPRLVVRDELPKPEKVERGNGENDRPHKQQPYYEGTNDNDGNTEPNIPRPEELPDQQKVGEPDPGNTDEHDHIET